MANPAEVLTNKTADPCNHCSICNEELIGKKFKIDELKKMLFSVFSASVEKGGIEGQKTLKAIANATRIQEKECKKMFNIQKPIVGDINGTLLVMIAAGLINYSITCDETDEGIVVLELASRPDCYAIQDDNAWKVIPARYLRE